MKSIIIIAIALVLFVPLNIFAQDSNETGNNFVRNAFDDPTIKEKSAIIEFYINGTKYEKQFFALSAPGQSLYLTTISAELEECNTFLDNLDELTNDLKEKHRGEHNKCVNEKLEESFIGEGFDKIRVSIDSQNTESQRQIQELKFQLNALSLEMKESDAKNLENNIIIAIVVGGLSIIGTFLVTRHFSPSMSIISEKLDSEEQD